MTITDVSVSQFDLRQIASCGGIVLYCMQLPLEVQFLLEKVYIVVGTTSILNAPDSFTISHIIQYMVNMVQQVSGSMIATYKACLLKQELFQLLQIYRPFVNLLVSNLIQLLCFVGIVSAPFLRRREGIGQCGSIEMVTQFKIRLTSGIKKSGSQRKKHWQSKLVFNGLQCMIYNTGTLLCMFCLD